MENPEEHKKLEQKADEGDTEAQKAVALLYELGLEGQEPDYERARHYWTKAAKSGDAQAQHSLGDIIVKGLDGSAPNKDLGLSWLMKASKQGFNPARKVSQFKLETNPPTILVVDDSHSIRQAIRLMLESDSYSVVAAENGKVALQMLEKYATIDLVYCDVDMPVMNGLEFIKRVRQENVYNAVNIVMVTSHGSKSMVEQAGKLGVKGWLLKPFEQKSILSIAKQFSTNG